MITSSKSSRKTRNVVLAAALAVMLLGADADVKDDGTSPPPGITATKTTLAVVLALRRKAVGKLTPGLAKTSSEQWTVHAEGLDGVSSDVTSGKDDRDDETLGPLHSASGTFAGKSWHQNQNGEVVIEHDLHHLDDTTRHSLVTADKNVALLGTTAAPDAYVVRVAPPGGYLEYLYYDRTTGNLVRKEVASRGRRHVSVYSDFRTTAGITAAWHQHTSDGRIENDGDYTRTSLRRSRFPPPRRPSRLHPATCRSRSN